MPLKRSKQSKKVENDSSSILLKFSRWVPLFLLCSGETVLAGSVSIPSCSYLGPSDESVSVKIKCGIILLINLFCSLLIIQFLVAQSLQQSNLISYEYNSANFSD